MLFRSSLVGGGALTAPGAFTAGGGLASGAGALGSALSNLGKAPAGSGNSLLDGLPGGLKSLLPIAGGLAAGLGTDKVTQQTTTREPWSEAQPLLKQLIGQGQTLAGQDALSPFKRQAMEKQAGLLNGINTQALPGLLESLQRLSTPYKRGGGTGAPTLTGLPTQFDPMQIFKRGG